MKRFLARPLEVSMAADEGSSSANLPIPARIRRRREDRGMTGAELARRVGVSPAYISLIETGAKVPRVGKAAEIALALDDEPAVYRAWAMAARGGNAGQSLTDLERGAYWASDRTLRKWLKDGEDLTVMRAEMGRETLPESRAEAQIRPTQQVATHRAHRAVAPARVLEVPVLEPGVDPGSGPGIPEALVVDRLLVDLRLVRGERLVRPFAFLAGGGTTERLQGEARPGDWVVINSAAGKPAPEAIYAVRLGRKIVLSRVVTKGVTLLLMPGQGQRNVEVIDLGEGGVLPHLAGRVALVVRRGD
jgi:transcriptional regulator with XRE-family HTH domain